MTFKCSQFKQIHTKTACQIKVSMLKVNRARKKLNKTVVCKPTTFSAKCENNLKFVKINHISIGGR